METKPFFERDCEAEGEFDQLISAAEDGLSLFLMSASPLERALHLENLSLRLCSENAAFSKSIGKGLVVLVLSRALEGCVFVEQLVEALKELTEFLGEAQLEFAAPAFLQDFEVALEKAAHA